MSAIERAKKVIEKHYEDARCGIFNTPNIAGDETYCIYSDKEIEIFICEDWMYFEVFGLDDQSFKELKEYYDSLVGDSPWF